MTSSSGSDGRAAPPKKRRLHRFLLTDRSSGITFHSSASITMFSRELSLNIEAIRGHGKMLRDSS